MPLSKTYTGPLSTSFALMGKLCFSMDLPYDMDSGATNEFMKVLEGRRVEVTIREVV
jgi:hypothetical protein